MVARIGGIGYHINAQFWAHTAEVGIQGGCMPLKKHLLSYGSR